MHHVCTGTVSWINILIYAQRPDAVACATMNIWNSEMGCWIKKGNRGIALIDESNSRKLKYVWDVASVVPKTGRTSAETVDTKTISHGNDTESSVKSIWTTAAD